MELSHAPRAPAAVLFIQLATPNVPTRWEQYLAPFGTSTAAAAA
jgi:hypothetical protein